MKNWAVTILALAIAAGAQAKPPTEVGPTKPVAVKSTAVWQVVGYTTQRTHGLPIAGGGSIRGISALSAMCAAEFPHSRVCYSPEVVRSVNDHAVIADGQGPAAAWIIPSDVRTVYDPDASPGAKWQAFDGASGALYPVTGGERRFDTPQRAIFDLGCAGFNRTNGADLGVPDIHGVAIDIYGVEKYACTNALRVACCAAVEVPLISP